MHLTNETTQELTMLREAVHRAARDKIAPIAASIDESGEFNRDVEALCWDLGLMTLALPQEFGGIERNSGTALCIAVEEIARFCASSALLLIIQAVGSFPIVHGLSPQIRDQVLSRIRDRRELVAYLVTETSVARMWPGLRPLPPRTGTNTLSADRSVSPPTVGWRHSIQSWQGRPGRWFQGVVVLVERDRTGLR